MASAELVPFRLGRAAPALSARSTRSMHSSSPWLPKSTSEGSPQINSIQSSGADHIAAAQLERIEPELFPQIFDRESGLRGAVAAEAGPRHHVGVDGVAVGLVRAAIGRERRCQGLAAVAAICSTSSLAVCCVSWVLLLAVWS